MLQAMTECGRKLDRADIEDLQDRLGIRLPRVYADFLLKYNGGRPHPADFPIHGLENNPYGHIQVFLRIDGPIESSTIDWNRETLAESMPDNLLAIACTGCGDRVCISLWGDDAGEVKFWDFRPTWGQSVGPSYDDVYHVADSFEEFIESLVERPL